MLSCKDVEFPNIPGNSSMKVDRPEDLDRYEDGYTNPYLLRVHEEIPVQFDAPDGAHSVPFDPYNQTPQFEFGPRGYLFYISGVNSYRLTDIHNHDEDSEFWEIP